MIEHMFDTLTDADTSQRVFNTYDVYDSLAEAAAEWEREAGSVEGLDDVPAGEGLAARLAFIDPDSLSAGDRVVLLRAHQRMVSHYQALSYADVGAIVDAYQEMGEDPKDAHDGASMELRGALRLTRRAADSMIDMAWDLNRRLPQVLSDLRRGDVDFARSRVVCHETTHLPDETARTVTDEVLSEASRLTTGQLRARVKGLCIEADTDDAKTRYDDALGERRIVTEPTDSGTADLLLLNAAPHRVEEAYRHIDYLARSLRTDGETRTIDQLRADVALDLLTGTESSKRTGRGTVTLHVDLATLTKLDDHPGDLAGFGPVISDIARQIADEQHHSEWRYLATHPDSDQPLYTGMTRRRPTAELRRSIETVHPTCVFPGCRMPATQSDIDHSKTWAETNTTNPDDLAPACRHDHVGRHQHDWTYQKLHDGDHLWTSPLGNKYTTTGRAPPPN
ncbi:MAG: DUF222 domain-containing protein [Acidimicrobiia bacterium]|nr:DUF222 domain-containing protein [Acidimicrobiia bacterium]